MRIVHLTPWAASVGGVETILQTQPQADALAGMEPGLQVALFDAPRLTAGVTHRCGLGQNGWRSLRAIGRALGRALRAQSNAMVIYHNAWGLPVLSRYDGAARRIAYCHMGGDQTERLLRGAAGLLDGVICVNCDSVQAARQWLPELEPERVVCLPAPFAAETGLEPRHDPLVAPWVVGYSGRLVRGLKRVDRLIELAHVLHERRLPVRLEIAGDGPERVRLERALGPETVFWGSLRGPRYWEVLRSWHAIVSVCDSEGIPLAFIEAMACGVLPVFPQISGSLLDEYLREYAPEARYSAGDMADLATALKRLMTLAPERVADLRAQGWQRSQRHRPENYAPLFADYANGIAHQPRLSAPRPAGFPRWWELLPLGVISRLPGQVVPW
jgi:glycosyltransferase involved in cell wall biosynthesis